MKLKWLLASAIFCVPLSVQAQSAFDGFYIGAGIGAETGSLALNGPATRAFGFSTNQLRQAISNSVNTQAIGQDVQRRVEQRLNALVASAPQNAQVQQVIQQASGRLSRDIAQSVQTSLSQSAAGQDVQIQQALIAAAQRAGLDVGNATEQTLTRLTQNLGTQPDVQNVIQQASAQIGQIATIEAQAQTDRISRQVALQLADARVKTEIHAQGANFSTFAGWGKTIGPQIYLGVESGYSYSTAEGSFALQTPVANARLSVENDHAASLVGRVGWVVKPNLMLYGLGGWELARYSLERGPSAQSSWTHSWKAGLGAEYAFPSGLFARVEWTHADLQSERVYGIEASGNRQVSKAALGWRF